ncbi:hypothetical protein Htur_4123 (plasmid) [Haloterrigena turkmenica DSM 5511]|uniref:Uncharacterized protein n=1 Tax=Haloterrigena turkmenica (strain ATCC 51198 / DSM 5511 / JCM 9101 / NCIMB 13204 / VKM B-1734 / 4k) TaxID=543526 RepID=D2S0Q3_HALTV|nr:hypothetical protein [Haloterrigena turkmenica]ADB62950.1 hypothetical protein Htur_4123 [Haloterrigena turkmenica DSM 5511]
MFEQIDHRGKRFALSDDVVENKRINRCYRAIALERQTQRELRELERAEAVAGPAGSNPDVKVLDR